MKPCRTRFPRFHPEQAPHHSSSRWGSVCSTPNELVLQLYIRASDPTFVIPAVQPMQHPERIKAGTRLRSFCCNTIQSVPMRGRSWCSNGFTTWSRL